MREIEIFFVKNQPSFKKTGSLISNEEEYIVRTSRDEYRFPKINVLYVCAKSI